MLLNGIDDELRLPIEMLKKANRLMRYNKATREEIALAIAERVKNWGVYRRLEKTDRINAVQWRLTIADPSHPAHARDWTTLLNFWRNRRHRQKIKKKRAEDPDFDIEYREKARDQKHRRIARDPEGYKARVKEQEQARDKRLKAENPAEWQRRRDHRAEVSNNYYMANRDRLNQLSKDRAARLKEEDPEKWAEEYEGRKVKAREWYQLNKRECNRRNRVRRAQRKARAKLEEANAHEAEESDEQNPVPTQ